MRKGRFKKSIVDRYESDINRGRQRKKRINHNNVIQTLANKAVDKNELLFTFLRTRYAICWFVEEESGEIKIFKYIVKRNEKFGPNKFKLVFKRVEND